VFETAELGSKLSKAEFAQQEPALRTELLRLQREITKAKVPVLILIHGLDGAGRGDVLNLLHEWLDARYLVTYAPGEPTEEERQRPEYWRYWMHLPARGQIAICFGSWYSAPTRARVYRDCSAAQFDAALARAKAFEQALVEDGTLVVKFWLHITKKQQEKRFERIERNPEAPWPVTKQDWKHHRLYAEFRRVASRALRQTSTADAPWTLIEAGNARHRDITVVRHLLERMARRLDAAQNAGTIAVGPAAESTATRTVLDTLDLSLALDKSAYDERLTHAQVRLNRLARKAFRKSLGVILLFEGWDAAGKGGAIRRVAHALDARNCRIIPIAAPTDEELAHHYLWRFWRHLPRLGRTTIYDRSWYGRVLVERVEGFATEAEWRRAYQEINDFEEALVQFGIVLCKFWVHISEDEQLRRFRERESKPWKQHKITAEDYRNREKWSLYEAAVADMVACTSTEYAPWTLVEGNDKRFARVKVVRTACERMEEALHCRR
jgi:polyphosphate:AMP phosphotransferase